MNPVELKISDALVKCNGQDLTRKGGKSKSRLLVILPAPLGVVPGAEGLMGELRDLHTEKPSFVMPTEEGDLSFPGRVVDSASSLYLGIELAPKKMQSVCTDITSRVLVFGQPKLLIGASTISGSTPSRGGSNRSVATEPLLTQGSQDGLRAPASVAATGDGTSTGAKKWRAMHGMSRDAQPSNAAPTKYSALRGRGAGRIAQGDESGESDAQFSDFLSEADEDDALPPKKRKVGRRAPTKNRRATASASSDEESRGDAVKGGAGTSDEDSIASGGSDLDGTFIPTQRRASSRSTARVSYIHESDVDDDEDEASEGISDSETSGFGGSKAVAQTPLAKTKTPTKTKATTPKTKTPQSKIKNKFENSNSKMKSIVEINDSEDEVRIIDKAPLPSAAKPQPKKRKSEVSSAIKSRKKSISVKINSDSDSEAWVQEVKKSPVPRGASQRPQRSASKRISFSQDSSSSSSNFDEESEYSED